jgi:hypothetical protein
MGQKHKELNFRINYSSDESLGYDQFHPPGKFRPPVQSLVRYKTFLNKVGRQF